MSRWSESGVLDRCEHLRRDDDWVADQWSSTTALLLAVDDAGQVSVEQAVLLDHVGGAEQRAGLRLEGEAELLLLDALLRRLQEEGLVKARGRQRTDSTHVLAAVRGLNRLEQRLGQHAVAVNLPAELPLIPLDPVLAELAGAPMLARFMAADRGFARLRRACQSPRDGEE